MDTESIRQKRVWRPPLQVDQDKKTLKKKELLIFQRFKNQAISEITTLTMIMVVKGK